jgi:hypothetical protein
MSRRDDSVDDPRRQFLVRALAAGALAGTSGWSLEALAGPFSNVLGNLPQRLAAGQSIFDLSGEVTINGQPATKASTIKPGDVVRTGTKSHLIGVIGEDALLLRANTEVEIAGSQAARKFFRLVTGGLLGVFGKRRDAFDIRTPVATIGVRGTGLYAESDPEKTYICTCYGKVDVQSVAEPAMVETITAQHHDAPRYVLAKAQDGKRIVPAGFIEHTDLELMTLEALVGREVPFKVSDTGEYLGPRREY